MLPLRLGSYDAVIIDLDGTLIDTLGDFVAAVNLMLEDICIEHQPRLERAQVERMVGKGSEHLVRSVLNWLEGQVGWAPPAINNVANDETLFDTAFASYQQHYLRINGQHSAVYPGVLQGLGQLQRAGLRLACLTNKPLAFAEALLRLKGLGAFFSLVFGGDSFERKKPDPLPLLKTCEALQSMPARTLMVGDSSNDAMAARAAGCPVVLVTYGYNHGLPASGVDADGFVDSLTGLLPA